MDKRGQDENITINLHLTGLSIDDNDLKIQM